MPSIFFLFVDGLCNITARIGFMVFVAQHRKHAKRSMNMLQKHFYFLTNKICQKHFHLLIIILLTKVASANNE